MNRFRTTLIIVVVFFGLLLFVYFFEKDRESKEEKELKEDGLVQEQVTDFPIEEVTKFTIEAHDQTYNLEKREDKWVLLEDEELEVNDLKAEAILDGFTQMKVQSLFEVEDFTEYGLKNPAGKLTIMRKDEEIVFEFGTATPDNQKIYMRKNQENKVFTAPNILFIKLKLEKEDWKKKEGEEADAMEEIEKLKIEQEEGSQ